MGQLWMTSRMAAKVIVGNAALSGIPVSVNELAAADDQEFEAIGQILFQAYLNSGEYEWGELERLAALWGVGDMDYDVYRRRSPGHRITTYAATASSCISLASLGVLKPSFSRRHSAL